MNKQKVILEIPNEKQSEEEEKWIQLNQKIKSVFEKHNDKP